MKLICQTGSVILLLALCGCGVYSFSAGGKAPFDSINVAPFDNNTKEFLLGDRLTDAVVEAFINDNSVQIKEQSRADAFMKGTVLSYLRQAHTYDKEDNVESYAVKVSVRIKVVKANTEDVIWEEDFFAEGIYDALLEVEEDGQLRVIAQLTNDIINYSTKSW
jgi:hypothetical protein